MSEKLYALKNTGGLRCNCPKKEKFYYLSWKHKTLVGTKEIFELVKLPYEYEVVEYESTRNNCPGDPINAEKLWGSYAALLKEARKYKHLQNMRRN